MEDQLVFYGIEMEFLKVYEKFNESQKEDILAIIDEAIRKQKKEKILADKTSRSDVNQWSKN